MFEGATRAQAILIELLNGLDPKHDPELCSRLSSLYTYMYTQLVKATSQRDPAMFAPDRSLQATAALRTRDLATAHVQCLTPG